MRKAAAATFIGLLLPAAASAADFRLGAIGVANFARIGYEPSPQGLPLDTFTRWGAGGVLELGLSEKLSLVAQPMYLGKGMKFSDGEVELRYEFNYVEVPLLVKYRLGGGGVRPFLQAGPSLGFSQKSQFTFDDGSREETADSPDEAVSTDFSLWLGGGLEIPAGGARAFVETGYAFGFADVMGRDDGEITTRGFQVKFGVTFGL